MKPLRILLSFALLLFVFSSTAQPALAQPVPATPAGQQAAILPTTGKTVYLPLVQKIQLTSYDLIDQAVTSGKITPEQGLIYKTYALFSDAALPDQYAGTIPEDGEMVMWQIAEQSGTLSAAAKTALAPFFVPPSYPGSWYLRSHLGALSAPQEADAGASWQFVAAAGGKVRVYYWSTNASDQDKATRIAAEFDSRIWSKKTTLMKKTPIPNAKTGATNIYLWASYQRYSGTVVPFSDTTLGITVAPKCQNTESTIYLPYYQPAGSIISPGLIEYATHEFMHVLQFSYARPACSPYDWAMEATATWAEDYVYPLADSEHDSAQGYLTYPERRLDDTEEMHDYGAYLLFYYLTHSVDTSGLVVPAVGKRRRHHQQLQGPVGRRRPGCAGHARLLLDRVPGLAVE